MASLRDKKWFELPLKKKELAYEQVWAEIQRISNTLSDRDNNNLHNCRMYSNTYFAAMNPTGYTTVTAVAKTKQRISLNVIANITDTVAARISKNKPKITYLTEGGNFKLIRQAKKLDKFMLGQFQSLDIYSLYQKAFFDSLICDIGVVKIYADAGTGKICAERVLPNEIKVDPVDAVYGNPSIMYQVKYIQKRTLKEMFPNIPESVIDQAASSVCAPTSGYSANSSQDEFAYVIEGWKLPSTANSDDGRHVISISNATLEYGKWERSRFPFVFFRWSERQLGFFGQSLSERLNGIQLEINAMLRDIQYSRQFFAVPFIGVEMGSKINRAQFNNVIAHIVDYVKTPPQFMVPPIAHQQWFDHLDRLVRQAYEIAGVSALSATSRKPAGLDAAVALREYQDIESERFILVGQRYEKAFLHGAELIIDAAKDLYGVQSDFSVKVKGKRFIETIKWKDIDLEEDQYVQQAFPTSMLPQTPAARLQWVSEMAERGYIDRDEAISLLEFPDLERSTNLLSAAHDNIMWNIEQIIDEGKYVPPSSYQDLERGVKMFTAAINHAEADGVPDERIDGLRDWVKEAKQMIDAAKALQVPPPEAQQEAPQPVGAPPQPTTF